MAFQLFITDNDLKRASTLSGNIDADKLLQYMRIAHQTHMQQYMGTDLYARFQAGLTADDLSTDERMLLDNYLKDMCIHWCLTTAMPFLPYTISNKGAFKHTSENSETITPEEVERLTQSHLQIAQNYTRSFIEHMRYNYTKFPEYSTNTNEDVKPNQEANYSGSWQLD